MKHEFRAQEIDGAAMDRCLECNEPAINSIHQSELWKTGDNVLEQGFPINLYVQSKDVASSPRHQMPTQYFFSGVASLPDYNSSLPDGTLIAIYRLEAVKRIKTTFDIVDPK